MSNNAAIRRRAGTATPNPVVNVQRNFQENLASNDPRNFANQNQSQPQPQGQGTGLTLQQVISLIDTRLVSLENVSKQTQETIQTLQTTAPSVSTNNDDGSSDISGMIDEKLEEYFSEFNTRTELLATEITNLKQIVLNLQAYTLEINKTLMEERIQILSDLPKNEFTSSSSEKNLQFFDMSNFAGEESNTNEIIELETPLQNEDERIIYDEEGLLADTTIAQDAEAQDTLLTNKKRQRASSVANNKKSIKVEV
jgi:hypothetical protein